MNAVFTSFEEKSLNSFYFVITFHMMLTIQTGSHQVFHSHFTYRHFFSDFNKVWMISMNRWNFHFNSSVFSWSLLHYREVVEKADSDPGPTGWWEAVSDADGAVEALSGEAMLPLAIQCLVWVQVWSKTSSLSSHLLSHKCSTHTAYTNISAELYFPFIVSIFIIITFWA